jgi:hypothetical protein
MSEDVSNYVPYQQEDTSTFLAESYKRLVNLSFEKGDLNEMIYAHLISEEPKTLDELDQCFSDLEDAIKNKRKYEIIHSLEKGSDLLDKLPPDDLESRKRYGFKLRKLAEELEKYVG